MAPSKDRRPGFSRRAQFSIFAGYVLAIAGAVVGAVLLALSAFNPQAFSAMRVGVAEVTAPVSGALASIGGGIAAVPETISGYFLVHSENARLRRERDAARRLVMQARGMAYENLHLRRLLQLRATQARTVTAARIVSTTASSTRRFGVLDHGLWQGVRPGMPVTGPNGLVGRVLEAGPNTARVLLLTDPDSVVPVRRARDGLPAIAAGRGDGTVDIRSVDVADAHLAPGDVFVTSGTGGLYAPGVPVARILVRARDTAPAQPFARPDTLDVALVSEAFMPAPPPRPLPPPGAK